MPLFSNPPVFPHSLTNIFCHQHDFIVTFTSFFKLYSWLFELLPFASMPYVIVGARVTRYYMLVSYKVFTYCVLHFTSGFLELSADLVEAAVAHCELIVVSK